MKNALFVAHVGAIFFLCGCTVDKTREIPTRYAPVEFERDSKAFYGYECTEDCSGHEAGYEWAEENGIDDSDDCDGYSDSFIEGCWAYVEENY